VPPPGAPEQFFEDEFTSLTLSPLLVESKSAPKIVKVAGVVVYSDDELAVTELGPLTTIGGVGDKLGACVGQPTFSRVQ
jgi:hypothetical protein